MTRLLITGASGFVGHALCSEAALQGFQVRCAVRTACQPESGTDNTVVGTIDAKTDWTDALEGVDVVIHLAARVHVMRDTAADPLAEFRQINLHGTTNLARQAARAGIG